jgi:hypothetical protein
MVLHVAMMIVTDMGVLLYTIQLIWSVAATDKDVMSLDRNVVSGV